MMRFGRLLTLLLLMTACGSLNQGIKPMDLSIHFIDVGYGDAILVDLPNQKHLLIDSGDPEHATILSEYLTNHHVTTLDYFLLTHSHRNHFGGIPALLKNGVVIKEFYFNGADSGEEGYEEVLQSIQQLNIPTTTLHRGDVLNRFSRDLSIEVIHPDNLSGELNRDSIALKLKFGDLTILLLGDITPEVQDELIQRGELKGHVVHVPHHGVSITKNFAQTLNPSLFIITTGPTQWSLPDLEETDLLEGEVLRTDLMGHIVVHTDGRKIRYSTSRS